MPILRRSPTPKGQWTVGRDRASVNGRAVASMVLGILGIVFLLGQVGGLALTSG